LTDIKVIADGRSSKITDGKGFTIIAEINAGELGKIQNRIWLRWTTHLNPFYCKQWNDFWNLYSIAANFPPYECPICHKRHIGKEGDCP
jgi:hypothetical protein